MGAAGVSVGVGELVGAGVDVGVEVGIGDGVEVGVAVGVGDGLGVSVGLGRGDGDAVGASVTGTVGVAAAGTRNACRPLMMTQRAARVTMARIRTVSSP